jgi:uncharacterized protein YpiB (UPF0302 family)
MNIWYKGEYRNVEDVLELLTTVDVEELIRTGELYHLIDETLDRKDESQFLKLTSLLKEGRVKLL